MSDTSFFVLFLAIIVAGLSLMFRRRPRRRRSDTPFKYPHPRHFSDPSRAVEPLDLSDMALDQFVTVTQAHFEPRPLLSKSEARIFYWAEAAVREANLPWRVMAQVSMGQILSSPDKNSHAAINAKRVDILIVTNSGYPVVAIEYQGEGHYQGNAPIRDAIKREALRKAGVGFLEVTPAHDRADLKREILRFAPSVRHIAKYADVAS
jgi:Protein of unknown function (DUF2726)